MGAEVGTVIVLAPPPEHPLLIPAFCDENARMRTPFASCVVSLSLLSACGAPLNETSVTCPAGRTFLDGVCVSEPVADYVACVRAQGAQLGADRSEKLSADASYLGAKVGGAAELNETLQKKYAASDQAMLKIIEACSGSDIRASLGSASAERGLAVAAHWPFDEAGGSGVTDASGHGNTGRIEGAGASWVAGKVDGSLKVEGSTTVLVDDNPTQHASRAISITGWFLASETTRDKPYRDWRSIIHKSNPKNGDVYGYGFTDENQSDEREYGVWLNDRDRLLHITAVPEDRYKNGGHVVCETQPGSVQFGKWHHFGAVIASQSRAMRLYLDGQLMVTCPLSEAGLRRTTSPLRIGAGWAGMLDDLRLHAAELDEAQIRALASAR